MTYEITDKEYVSSFFKLLDIIEEIENEQEIVLGPKYDKYTKEVADAIIDKMPDIIEVGIIIAPITLLDMKRIFMDNFNIPTDGMILDLGDNATEFFDAGGMITTLGKHEFDKYTCFRAVVSSVYENVLDNLKENTEIERKEKENLIKLTEKIIKIMSMDKGVYVTGGYENISKLKTEE